MTGKVVPQCPPPVFFIFAAAMPNANGFPASVSTRGSHPYRCRHKSQRLTLTVVSCGTRGINENFRKEGGESGGVICITTSQHNLRTAQDQHLP